MAGWPSGQESRLQGVGRGFDLSRFFFVLPIPRRRSALSFCRQSSRYCGTRWFPGSVNVITGGTGVKSSTVELTVTKGLDIPRIGQSLAGESVVSIVGHGAVELVVCVTEVILRLIFVDNLVPWNPGG